MGLSDSDISDNSDFWWCQQKNQLFYLITSKILFLLSIILFFASCHNKKQVKNKIIVKVDSRLDVHSLKEAKYSDISVPLGYKFVKSQKEEGLLQTNDNSDHLCFVGNFQVDQVLDFYMKNMELWGWEIVDFSAQEEGLLVCNKLNKSCVISIRENKNDLKNKGQTSVYMFVRHKKGGTKNYTERDINSKLLVDDF